MPFHFQQHQTSNRPWPMDLPRVHMDNHISSWIHRSIADMNSPSSSRSHHWNRSSTPITIPQLRGLETRVDSKSIVSQELKENINDGTPSTSNISSCSHYPLKTLQPSQLTASRSSGNSLVPRPATHFREANSPLIASTFLPSHHMGKRNTPPNRGKWTGAAILRPGESMETFFGIDQESTDEYRQICRSIVNGIEDNAKTWRRVLELASERAEKDRAWFSNGKKSNVGLRKTLLLFLTPVI